MHLNNITQKYLHLFPTDSSKNTYQRITPKVLSALVDIAGFPKARLIHFNEMLSKEIGLGTIETSEDKDFLNATALPQHITSYATAYAGHQFGQWAGQLGDGRAIFAGEISNAEGMTTELQWKGAGATPYSRTADGRAVLRSTIREYLMSEAMHHLNIPTTRALSLSFTGESVLRDIQYSGNPQPESGAVMMRTANSFLRFGHFELISAQKEYDLLKQLADFTIDQYFPEIASEGKQKYMDWFQNIAHRTAKLMVEWYRVGFTHGVMNTDNMSILGQTIDYGPFSMLDEYDLNFTPNTTDLPGRRYAFGEQGKIAQWNLWQLANALFPLIGDSEALQEVLNQFSDVFWNGHDEMLANKMGFDALKDGDVELFTEWQHLMQELKMDYTLFFSQLESWLIHPDYAGFKTVSYKVLTEEDTTLLNRWLNAYAQRMAQNTISKEASVDKMKRHNPKFILRNYLLYQCIQEVENGKMELFNQLFSALQHPYEMLYPELCVKRPSEYDEQWGCTSLSCSS